MNYKYYVIHSSNGSLQLDKVTEYTDLTKAIVGFHDRCKTLWNTESVIEGVVQLVYSANLAVVSYNGTTYSERISHPQTEQAE